MDVDMDKDTDTAREEARAGSVSRNSYPKEFETFWLSYPKKVGKGAAYASWRRIKDRPAIAVLTASVEAHIRTEEWTRENGRYIPNPATYLNQRRWEDESAPTAKKPTKDTWALYVAETRREIAQRRKWLETHQDSPQRARAEQYIADLEAKIQ